MKKPEFQMGDFFMVGVNNMKNAAGIRQVEKIHLNVSFSSIFFASLWILRKKTYL